ncbi:MFS transporter [Candidatus Pseudothioglobus singularis]|nr:MFS transporter [Candidatus Pseudothioglobus singularis]
MGENQQISRERSVIFSIYLVAVFLNAFVDLGHKIIIQNTIFMIYGEQQQIILTAIVNAMILVPFILLFTLSGHLSDKFAKTSVMRFSAFSAVLITLGITYCYYNGLYKTAFGFTLLLATQSAIYSPAKMGYIKECLSKAGLSRGNALHSSVVLIAILLGTVFFSYLFEAFLGTMQVSTPEEILMKIAPVGWVLVGLSTVEFLATLGTRFYPTKLSSALFSIPKLISFKYLSANFKAMRSNEIVWYSILGTAIFWGMSQNLVAVIPAHAKVNFGVESPLVVNAMLASSVIGIMIGAFLSGRKSVNFIRINNIYTGSIMITVCAILVPVISSLTFIPNSTALILVTSVILLFGVGAGMMIVPLNALMQAHSPEDGLGSMLAGKNWLQNIAMISLLIFTVILANLSFGSEFILYFNAFIAVAGFSIVLKKLKAIL